MIGTLLFLFVLWLGLFFVIMAVPALAIICKRNEKETFSSLLTWSAIGSLGVVITYCALRGLGG